MTSVVVAEGWTLPGAGLMLRSAESWAPVRLRMFWPGWSGIVAVGSVPFHGCWPFWSRRVIVCAQLAMWALRSR